MKNREESNPDGHLYELTIEELYLTLRELSKCRLASCFQNTDIVVIWVQRYIEIVSQEIEYKIKDKDLLLFAATLSQPDLRPRTTVPEECFSTFISLILKTYLDDQAFMQQIAVACPRLLNLFPEHLRQDISFIKEAAKEVILQRDV